jgi:peptide-methionine (S)-S-oxide reductase
MRNRILLFSVSAAVIAAAGFTAARAANFPDPPKVSTPATGTASVVLAGGCYWGMQGIFEHMKGVTNTVVGFAGGKKETARYEIVEDGTTGHAESIKITYDPAKITYGDLLKVYFSVRSNHAEPPALRCWDAVPVRDLLCQRRAEERS